eukprot:scaffold38339_cov29-Prasinocladus_malaysianus.AAC.1
MSPFILDDKSFDPREAAVCNSRPYGQGHAWHTIRLTFASLALHGKKQQGLRIARNRALSSA